MIISRIAAAFVFFLTISAVAEAPNLKPKISINPTYISAFGHYNRPSDAWTKTSILIKCFKSSMECLEVIATPEGGGRPSIDSEYYNVTTWNAVELVADFDGDCFVQRIHITFADETVTSLDIPKAEQACEPLLKEGLLKTEVFSLLGN